MISLTLGVLAALLWGLHDFCVRYVSARSAPLPLLVTVLGTGSLLLLPLAAAWGDWGAMSGRAFGLAALSGLAYMLGCIALYDAFAIDASMNLYYILVPTILKTECDALHP